MVEAADDCHYRTSFFVFCVLVSKFSQLIKETNIMRLRNSVQKVGEVNNHSVVNTVTEHENIKQTTQ